MREATAFSPTNTALSLETHFQHLHFASLLLSHPGELGEEN